MNGSIRKRSKGSWELTIDMGKDASGKRRRKFLAVKGTKTQAQQKLRELLTSLDRGIPVGTSKLTFADWLTKWFSDYVVPKTRQRSQERYEGLIRIHILPSLGHIELAKVTPSDIQELEARLLANGMAPKGVAGVHGVISGAFKYALRMEKVWRNPAKAIPPPTTARKEVEPPVISRVKGILNQAEREEHPLFACLHLIAYSGLRRGEALGLRHQDLDLELGTNFIVQTISRSVEKGIIVEPTKTAAGRRVLDIDDITVNVLRAHIGRQLLYRMELGEAYQDNGLLFPGPLGEPLNPMKLTRAFQGLAKKQGIERAKLHNLRHFHASVMLQSGASLLLVSRRLGHASISTTGDVYGHLLPGWQKDAANNFARAMEEG